MAKLAKARNARVLFGLGCLAGFVGLYFSWLFFFRADYGMEFPLNMVLQVGSNPSQLWELIGEVNKSGWWAGGPSGILQWLVTAIEGIFFVLGVGILTSGSLDRRVFCEACDQWLKPAAVSHLRFTGEMADKFDKDDEEADFDHLEILRLPETSEEEVPRFEAETLECAGCGAKAVRLKLLAHQESDDGEMGLEEIDLPGVLFQSASGDAQAS